jgi:hypothetical protein
LDAIDVREGDFFSLDAARTQFLSHAKVGLDDQAISTLDPAKFHIQTEAAVSLPSIGHIRRGSWIASKGDL